MPIPSPFHSRTAPLCTSYRWKDWAGVHAVCSYDTTHDAEYFAFRESAGLLDVSPLFKYELRGPDAAALLSRMTVRDVGGLAIGRVIYCCWCDDDGMIVDDGTITRLDEDRYRLTAADPTYGWLCRLAVGYRVEVEDVSRSLAALALQGPTSREVLRHASDAPVDALRFFGAARCHVDGLDAWVTRTGYTGDLGYEIWVAAEDAPRLWDAVLAAGRPHGLLPAGLDALDMTRIEAGFILSGVDYFSSRKVVVEARKSTPFEVGLGWMVKLERSRFVGRGALAAEKRRGSRHQLVGLELDWEELETLYASHGLPASLPAHASREALPVYAGREQAGRATSHTWSPVLKKPIALATLRSAWAGPGTRLEIEHTVEFERRRVTATVVPTPFFDPERKRKP